MRYICKALPSAEGTCQYLGCARLGALALGDQEMSGLVLGISNSRGGWEVKVSFQ